MISAHSSTVDLLGKAAPDDELSSQHDPVDLSPSDMDMLRSLDQEYINAVSDSEISLKARIVWARRSAEISVAFMVLYLVIGLTFFQWQTDWAVIDTLLFSVYTATSAGFGHVDIPKTPLVQVFEIFYMLGGVAGLAIMVAQVFQIFQLEASRAETARDKSEIARAGLKQLASEPSTNKSERAKKILEHFKRRDRIFHAWQRMQDFFRETSAGRFLRVFLPLSFLVLFGALVIGGIEGWSFLEGVYFGVVSMTTVGYGDYVPETTAGLVITLFWLPFNIIWVSLYMGSVANWYFALAATRIEKIEKNMKSKHAQQHTFNRSISTRTPKKEKKDKESRLKITVDLDDDGWYSSSDDSNSSQDVDFSDAADAESEDDWSQKVDLESGEQVPTEIIPESGEEIVTESSSSVSDDKAEGDNSGSFKLPEPYPMARNMFTSHLATFGDIIEAVHAHAAKMEEDEEYAEAAGRADRLKILSLKTSMDKPDELDNRPCFALRVLVKERLAAIIATDIAGAQSVVEVHDGCALGVSLGGTKETAEKWLIPRRARKAFRVVAFEAIFFVGEHALLSQGVKALYGLCPDEFHRIFGPLVASMGDAEMLEEWLASTEVLVDKYLTGDASLTEEALHKKHRKMSVEAKKLKMPVSQATAFGERKSEIH